MPFHSKVDLNADIDEDMAMSVPHCTVAYPGEERDALPELSGRRVLRMPLEARGAEAVDALESLREAGSEYLVLPRTSFGWLEATSDLAAHLEDRYTLVVETDRC